MTATRNITRYESSKGCSYSFEGWRLCITREKVRFVRYFSDREHGGDAAAALQHAQKMRDEILQALSQVDAVPSAVFDRFRKAYG